MQNDFVTIVSGFGRCGSSMLMQMLYAGGMPIDLEKAPWPFCEDSRQTRRRTHQWLQEYIGSALKWLEPTEFPPPAGWPYRVIWLDRSVRNQAKSWLKYMKKQRPDVPVARNTVGEFRRRLRARRPKAVSIWRRLTDHVLELKYESVKTDPLAAAIAIEEFLRLGLDVPAMVRAVADGVIGCRRGFLEGSLQVSGPPTRDIDKYLLGSAS